MRLNPCHQGPHKNYYAELNRVDWELECHVQRDIGDHHGLNHPILKSAVPPATATV